MNTLCRFLLAGSAPPVCIPPCPNTGDREKLSRASCQSRRRVSATPLIPSDFVKVAMIRSSAAISTFAMIAHQIRASTETTRNVLTGCFTRGRNIKKQPTTPAAKAPRLPVKRITSASKRPAPYPNTFHRGEGSYRARNVERTSNGTAVSPRTFAVFPKRASRESNPRAFGSRRMTMVVRRAAIPATTPSHRTFRMSSERSLALKPSCMPARAVTAKSPLYARPRTTASLHSEPSKYRAMKITRNVDASPKRRCRNTGRPMIAISATTYTRSHLRR